MVRDLNNLDAPRVPQLPDVTGNTGVNCRVFPEAAVPVLSSQTSLKILPVEAGKSEASLL